MSERGRRKVITGVVKSAKMDKTIVVRVDRLVKHEQYGKYIRRHSACYAHDENNECLVGDEVIIQESRPLSRQKRWRVIERAEQSA